MFGASCGGPHSRQQRFAACVHRLRARPAARRPRPRARRVARDACAGAAGCGSHRCARSPCARALQQPPLIVDVRPLPRHGPCATREQEQVADRLGVDTGKRVAAAIAGAGARAAGAATWSWSTWLLVQAQRADAARDRAAAALESARAGVGFIGDTRPIWRMRATFCSEHNTPAVLIEGNDASASSSTRSRRVQTVWGTWERHCCRRSSPRSKAAAARCCSPIHVRKRKLGTRPCWKRARIRGWTHRFASRLHRSAAAQLGRSGAREATCCAPVYVHARSRRRLPAGGARAADRQPQRPSAGCCSGQAARPRAVLSRARPCVRHTASSWSRPPPRDVRATPAS